MRLSIFSLAAAPLVLVALADPVLAADFAHLDPRAPGLSPAEKVEVLLRRVRAEQADIETLTADFVQRKVSDLLLEPEESRGHFAFRRPDRVVWEYESPDRMHVLIDRGEMLTWYEDLGKVEVLEVGRYSDRILEYLAAPSSLELLQQYFDVTVRFPDDPREPYRLDLEPKSRRVERRLAGMTIWLDPGLFVPRRLRYQEGDGDVTEYEFLDLELNPEIPSGRFRLDLPPGVEVRTVELDPGGRS